VVDIPVDREIWMIYTSQLRRMASGYWRAMPRRTGNRAWCDGGGVIESGLPAPAPLTWDEFARDLRLAWLWCDNLFIFSLEGCVEQGFLDRVQTFDWDLPILTPDAGKARVDAWRGTIQSGLWIAQRVPYILAGVGAGLIVWRE